MDAPTKTDQSSQSVELGNLLATTIGAVAEAQERMDAYTMRRKQEYEEAPEGSLALPPLWYVFDKVAVEIELSATVRESHQSIDRRPAAQLFCRTLTPAAVSLYGREASAGLRVRVQLGLCGVLPLKDAAGTRG